MALRFTELFVDRDGLKFGFSAAQQHSMGEALVPQKLSADILLLDDGRLMTPPRSNESKGAVHLYKYSMENVRFVDDGRGSSFNKTLWITTRYLARCPCRLLMMSPFWILSVVMLTPRSCLYLSQVHLLHSSTLWKIIIKQSLYQWNETTGK